MPRPRWQFGIAAIMVLIAFGAVLVWPIAALFRRKKSFDFDDGVLLFFSYLVVFVFFAAYLIVRSELARRRRQAEEAESDDESLSDTRTLRDRR
jgi:hypothetical protein